MLIAALAVTIAVVEGSTNWIFGGGKSHYNHQKRTQAIKRHKLHQQQHQTKNNRISTVVINNIDDPTLDIRTNVEINMMGL